MERREGEKIEIEIEIKEIKMMVWEWRVLRE